MKTLSEEQPIQSRGDFMRSLGMSSAALMAFYCMGTISSCKSSDSTTVTPVTPTTGSGVTGTTTGSALDFTLDLTNKDYSGLKTVGGSAKVGDVFIANTKSGTYIALERLCPHANLDQLVYQTATDDVLCTHQSSLFKTDGSLLRGPAARSLKKYTTVLSTDGNKLQVKV